MDVAKHVLRSEGGMRGLFKGLVKTFAREISENAAMFGVYEVVKQLLAEGQDTSKLGRGSLIVAGGLAVGAFWAMVSYFLKNSFVMRFWHVMPSFAVSYLFQFLEACRFCY
ncbi:hypothetical protein ACHQM5_004474 [Ranunculus cassubicifolius]